MNRKKIFLSLFLVSALSLLPVYADYDYADSAEFPLDLLSFPLGGSYDYTDSSQFSLDLYPVNRDWDDSAGFDYDWLANCEPQQGPYQDPVIIVEQDLLKQLNTGGNWVTPFSFPSQDDIVIIINHGWNDSPDGMLTLAQVIAVEIPTAFIYTWHWGDGPDIVSDANPNGKSAGEDFADVLLCNVTPATCLLAYADLGVEVTDTASNALEHGRQLGNTLLSYGIRPDEHQIHMIGHSFGGVVCAEAAKVLYNDTDNITGSKVKQLTTLDTPELLVHAVSSVDPQTFDRVEVLYYYWYEDLLLGGTGGPLRGDYDNVLNLSLNSLYYTPPWMLHSKVVEWYTESVSPSTLNCQSERYGFGWSFSIDPMNPYWDIKGNQEETFPTTKGCLVTLPELVEEIVDTIINTAEEKFESAADWVGNKAEIVIDNVQNNVNSAIKLSLIFSLPLSGPQILQMAQAQSQDPNSAYIYKDIDVPADAEEVVFDLRFLSASQGDLLTLSIEDEILVVIDAGVAGTSDSYSQSFPANIRDYAGQTVLLQIALRPTGEGTSEVLIDNIRFTLRTIPGDFDGNKIVDIDDATIMALQWVQFPSEPSADIAPAGGDNIVNFNDFGILNQNWQVDLNDPNSL